MYLKSLKLAGFKSFVDTTTIPIKSNLNAVVGPNGCGKSNIVDAVLWVIGETSAKKLRGQSMVDVIFNGTSTRKPVSKALVELIFDNSDGRAGGEYAKFSEIAIRRELERNGQSSYFINGTLCRRRDVVDIFLGTGLGPRSYAIVEQGMIAQLIEAKPEEFRVYLEEAAGISKYKERRRETENRIRRTQDNLHRLDDLCEELTKQLRHLKRQANAAERYTLFKEEERLVNAQIKGLQWRALANDLDQFKVQISAVSLEQEAQLAEQRHLETDIEKARLAQIEANDRQNDVQKRYYALGAEIARLEQQIKDTQEQTQRWRNELEEAEQLWEELTESTGEHQDQIQEITQEIETLTPQKETIQSVVDAAQRALHEAEANMQSWQEAWEDYQKTRADMTQRIEVARTNITHYEQQQDDLSQQEKRLLQQVDSSALDTLQQEIVPLEAQVDKLSGELATTETALNELSEAIITQRQQNGKDAACLNESRSALQNDESRYASLQSLQASALAGDQQANRWLDQQNLANANRLGKMLRVKTGWALAVETVLVGYLDAVCVDDLTDYTASMGLEAGCLTLIDRHTISRNAANNTSNATEQTEPNELPKLAEQVESDWPVTAWLANVYTADSTQAAVLMRDRLLPHESVITKEGLWIGANWIRKAKPVDSKAGVLNRERELERLSECIAEKQKIVDVAQAAVDAGQAKLAALENDRDAQHKQYQLLSQAHTKTTADLSAKQSRLLESKQQQTQLQHELSRSREQNEKSKEALLTAKTQLENALTALQAQAKKKDSMIADRDRYRETLGLARETAQREKQKADELEIRLSSNNTQLSLLKQTVSRAERQMQQLNERRENLAAQLADTDSPLDHLNLALQEKLNQRIEIEAALHKAEEALASCNQAVRHLETKRRQIQTQLDDIKDRLQSINMERQTLVVRQTTIQEQLADSDFILDQILEAMPEAANIQDWEQRAEQLAQKINRLGPINLAAIKEYEQISERKAYLDQQQADLREALAILQDAIHKIDRETRQKFKNTYEKVKDSFVYLFPKIFGGGNATLELETDDLLTSGVVVRAQPPGKRNATIYMLSGGEKALTAISLVFALFQLNPAPFCILDEVDAPLDDVNVGRFCQLVKAMSKNTQFIVISHNKVTIEMANNLMGVTMQEAGVSRMVSVDMEEAIAMTEA